MRIKGIILFTIILLLGFNVKISAKNYAVLISAGRATADDAHENCEFWYDLFMIYTTLIDNGYNHDDVYVLYGDGSEFQSSHSCYQNPYPSSIVDFPDNESYIINIFNSLSNILTDDDFLYIWWMGHGTKGIGPDGQWHFKVLIENTGEEIWDFVLASYFDQVQHYRQRAISIMTCRSGGIINDVQGPKSIVMASSKFSESSESRILCDTYHAEFSYFEALAFSWHTPCNLCGSVNTDINQDSRISFGEAFDYTFSNVHLSTPQMSDPGYFADKSFLGYYQMNCQVGSNLIGLPYDAPDRYYLSFFPDAVPFSLFTFDNRYIQEDSLEFGRGYWLKFTSQSSALLEGTAVYSLTLSLNAGWNMIAGLSYTINIAGVNDPNGIIIPNTLFRYEGGYIQTDSIEPGKGYWLQTAANGQITLTYPQGGQKSIAKKWNLPVELKDYPELKISDASGGNTSLFFDVTVSDPAEKLSFSLPPLPPPGNFDARFSGGFRIAGGDEAFIKIQSSSYPVTIRANNLPVDDTGQYILRTTGKTDEAKTYFLNTDTDIIITNPRVSMLKLTKVDNTPGTFSVQQNYPNPFNPTTVINYHLPQPAMVKIVIFNALGQKVRTLVSETQDPGFYQTTWDATNDAGHPVGSGLFFYTIKAGKYLSKKKMVLIR
ncbi:MAG: FlgD immunoglobulin-like domain containing protein [Calditrichia bacterium]